MKNIPLAALVLAKFEGELLRQELTGEMVNEFKGQVETQMPTDEGK